MSELEKLADGRDWMDFPTKCGSGLTIDAKSAIQALEEIAISSEGLHHLASVNWKQNASMLRNIVELIERMHASLASRSSPEWQPIETAPKDGTTITVWHRVWKCPVSARYIAGRKSQCKWVEATITTEWPDEAFTHWRPMLDPPANLEQT